MDPLAKETEALLRRFRNNLLIGELEFYARLPCKYLPQGALAFEYCSPHLAGASSLNGVEYIVDGSKGYTGIIGFHENHNLYFANLRHGFLDAPDETHCAFFHAGSISLAAKWHSKGLLHRIDDCASLCAIMDEPFFMFRQYHIDGKHLSHEEFLSLKEKLALAQHLPALTEIDEQARSAL